MIHLENGDDELAQPVCWEGSCNLETYSDKCFLKTYSWVSDTASSEDTKMDVTVIW